MMCSDGVRVRWALLWAVPALWCGACNEESGSRPNNVVGAPTGGTGTETNDGGVLAGEGGTGGGNGGDGGDNTQGAIGTVAFCADAELTDLELIHTVGEPCGLCPNATCLPASLVMDPEQAALLADCDDGGKCVPDAFAVTGGQVKLTPCASLNGAEGRCIPTCIPQVAAQADALPQDVCANGELCAPCFDPFSGEPSGACNLGCTDPPTSGPVVFEACCGGTGSCVSEELAGERADQLGADTCSQASGPMLCAPNDIISDRPAHCRSINDAEGRCLSRCLNTVKSQEDTLPVDTCPETHRCVPCFDPRYDEPESTGGCDLNGDAPTEPPKPFSHCCGGEARCVPESSIPEASRGGLSRQECDAGYLCTPRAAVLDQEGGFFAGNATCRTQISGLGALVGNDQPGICAPLCFQPPSQPLIGGQPLQGTCASNQQFCAPCIHPTENNSTGACPP